MKKPIVVSGIQPTGNLHLGNYLGAVKNWVEMQDSDQYDMHIFIADLHSLTGDKTAKERKEQIMVTAAELLAAGIDPEKTTFWVQSHVAECTELAWVFNTVAQMSELERMTQFKDKSGSQKNNINVGLFTYPVLMAADILLYGGNLVPVGEDQIQHLELTRDVAKWFNKKYKTKYFAPVKAKLTKISKVKSLLEPDKKMSKSKGLNHVIELADEPNVIAKKLKKAVTATNGGDNSQGAKNLLDLLQTFGEPDVYKRFSAMEKDGSIRYGDLKVALGDAIADEFKDFRETRKELLTDHDKLAEILMAGANKSKQIAQKNIIEIKKIVGIL